MNDFMIILFRTFLGYFIVNILMRIMGKREIGQLSLFDLLILLTIVDIMVIGIENYKEEFYKWIIPMIIMALLQVLFSYLALKIVWFRNIIDGSPSIIVSKGILNEKNMKKNKYNMDDLHTQLRQEGIRCIQEVEYAILETSGKLSVFTYNNSKVFPIPIIVSGKINKEALKEIKKDENWIYQEIEKNNIKNIKDIFSASFVEDHLIFDKNVKLK